MLKDKIRLLVLAPYPHPDVAALTRALSRRRYYQTDVVVLSAGTKVPKKATYDVALLYDAFGAPEMEEIYAKLQRKKTPLWWFFTDRSRLPSTSSTSSTWDHSALKQAVALNYAQKSPISPIIPLQNHLFTTHTSYVPHAAAYPPLEGATFELKEGAKSHILIHQKVHNKPTKNNPSVDDSTIRQAAHGVFARFRALALETRGRQ